MSATFEIDGREFIAFNGGPMFKFTEAISLFVRCDTQEEIDRLWDKLSEGGQKQKCGWLKDKYGVSWQIIPPVLGQMLQDKDPAKSKRVMQAMLQMDKIDIAALQQALRIERAQHMPKVILTGSICQHVGGLGSIDVVRRHGQRRDHDAGGILSRAAGLGGRRAGRCCGAM